VGDHEASYEAGWSEIQAMQVRIFR
jgi:hypothetical protein